MYHNPRPDAMENRCAGIDFWVRGVVQYIIVRDLICKEVRRVNPLNAVLRDTVSGLQKLFGDRLKKFGCMVLMRGGIKPMNRIST